MKYIINFLLRSVLLIILSSFLSSVNFPNIETAFIFCIVTSLVTIIVRLLAIALFGTSLWTGNLGLLVITFGLALIANIIAIYFILQVYSAIQITSLLGFILTAIIVSADFSGMEHG